MCVLLFVYLLFVCLLAVYFVLFVFFFKQKTAYEMRISDWSSDVCSSDCTRRRPRPRHLWQGRTRQHRAAARGAFSATSVAAPATRASHDAGGRSEERRVGEEGVSTGRSAWWPEH